MDYGAHTPMAWSIPLAFPHTYEPYQNGCRIHSGITGGCWFASCSGTLVAYEGYVPPAKPLALQTTLGVVSTGRATGAGTDGGDDFLRRGTLGQVVACPGFTHPAHHVIFRMHRQADDADMRHLGPQLATSPRSRSAAASTHP